MKLNKAEKQELALKLNSIATVVANKPVYVVISGEGYYDVINYYNKQSVVDHIPSKSLAKFICESLNNPRTKKPVKDIQAFVNIYAKHYYDCEFYKHTIRTTKDRFKRAVTITRLDISIEYLKQAASHIRKSC
jgi:hypothetical protein